LQRREKVFWLLTGLAMIVGVMSLIPAHYEICEVAEKTKDKDCASYQFVPFIGIKVAQILDKAGAAVTALATIFIALFTLTLKRATDRLWDAGERQLKLLADSSTAQSRDMQASIATANAAVNVTREAHQAERRTWLKITLNKVGPVTFENGNFKVMIDLNAENVGNNPAMVVRLNCRFFLTKRRYPGRVEIIQVVEEAKARSFPAVDLLPGEKTQMGFWELAQTSARIEALEQAGVFANIPLNPNCFSLSAVCCVIYKVVASNDWKYSSQILTIHKSRGGWFEMPSEDFPVGTLHTNVEESGTLFE
jgi:hypothetical protein